MASRESGWKVGQGAIVIASIVVLVFLLGAAWITSDRVNRVLGAKDWVVHTQRVKTELETIYGTVATAESDVRAYMLSKDEPSYRRYLGSQNVANDTIRHVRELTRDNRSQGPRLDRLQAAVDFRYEAMRRSSETRRTRDLNATLAILTSGPHKGEGLRAMNEVRGSITALTGEEDRLLKVRESRNAEETLQAEASFVLTVVIGIVLISAFGLLASRLLAQRDEAAAEEREFRADLEREFARTRAAEARLEAATVELRRSNEELQNFAFVASHDLQEPLRKIRAFSDRVRRRAGAALDDESKDSLQRVEAAADRMQRLILDLLELSRVTTKTRPAVVLSLAQTVEEVKDDLQTRLEDTGGEVVHAALPEVVADPAQLRQLFQNLIANALKFRREGVPPVIAIEASTLPDGRIDIVVRDNGIGFEEKYADRIFVVFQRLHGRGEYEGSGIGLAIVRKIVERHGGNIRAEGRPGEGATFHFDLPGPGSKPVPGATVDSGETE